MDRENQTPSSTTPKPRLLMGADYGEVEQLKQNIATAVCRLPPNTRDSQELSKARAEHDAKITSLHLPTCLVKFTVWTHFDSVVREIRYVKLVLTLDAWPNPQPFLSFSLPSKEAQTGVSFASLKAHIQAHSSRAFMLPISSNAQWAFFINWETAFKAREEIDLDIEGRPLAREWLQLIEASLKKYRDTEVKIQTQNLEMLLETLAKHSCCFFTESEFAPFLKTLTFNPSNLTTWRAQQFLRPDPQPLGTIVAVYSFDPH
jgi:hypothetical protein